jgi:hypothetical protein
MATIGFLVQQEGNTERVVNQIQQLLETTLNCIM